jgi:glutathione S-transferase
MLQIVKLALFEKEIPYHNQQINFSAREQKSFEYLKLQPFGVVPVIDDDGYVLYGNILLQLAK